MATYAQSTYGSSLYGPTLNSLLLVTGATATPVAFNTVRLSWTNPGSTVWQRLRLVRSQYGYPANQDDGSVLLDLNCGPAATGTKDQAATQYTDSGLTPGRFYYYSWFVSQPVGNSIQWTKAGDVLGQSVKDHAYGNYLINRVPSIFASASGSVEEIPGAVNSALASFLDLIGSDLSRTRDYLDRLSYMTEPETVHGSLLPQLVQMLGFTYEPMIGMRLNRGLAYDAAMIHRQGGTRLSVVALAQDVMDSQAEVLPMVNLMLDDNDSSFEQSLGNWTVIAGSATAVRDTTVSLADGTNPSVASMKVTATATGTVSLSPVNGTGTTPITHSIPVTAGTIYIASAYFRSATSTIQPTIDVAWYDQHGAHLSTTAGVVGATTTTTDWSCRVSTTATAPTGAVYAAPVVNFPSMTNATSHYVDQVQFEDPTNIVANSSFETDTSGWTGIGENLLADPSMESGLSVWGDFSNCTLAQSTAAALDGTHSMSMTATAPGNMFAVTDSLRSQQVAAPGRQYTAVAFIKTASTPRNAYLQLRFVNAAGTSVTSSAFSSQYADNATGWTMLRAVGVADLSAVTVDMVVTVVGCAASEVHYVDCVGIYETPVLPGGGVNLVNNADFEIDTTDWTTGSGVTLSRTTADSYVGAACLQAVIGSTLAANNPIADGAYTYLTPNTTYVLSMYVKAPAGTPLLLSPGNATLGSGNFTATGSWQRLQVIFNSSTGNNNPQAVFPQLGTGGVVNPCTIYIDAVKIEAAPLANAVSAAVGSQITTIATAFVPRQYSNLAINGNFGSPNNGGIGSWVATSHATESVVSGQLVGAAALQLVVDSTDPGGAGAVNYDLSTVEAGKTYTLSAYMKAIVGSGNWTAQITWASDQSFSTYQTDIGSVIDVGGGWVRIAATSVAPAWATAARCDIRTSDTTAENGTFLLCGVQLELGYQANPYVDGSLGVGYSWDNSNNLITNSSFETDTSGWTGLGENLLTADQASFETSVSGWLTDSNTTKAQSGAEVYDGTHSMSLTAVAAKSPVGVYAYTPIGTSGFPVTPGRLYTAVGNMRAGSTPQTCAAVFYWYDSAGNGLGGPTGSSFTDNSAEWTQVRLVAVAPSNAAYGAVSFQTNAAAAAGEVHYLDGVGVYETPLISGGGVNIIDNDDFEVDTNGWYRNNADTSTITRSTANAYVGAASLLYSTGTTPAQYGAPYTQVNVVAGTTYTASAWIYQNQLVAPGGLGLEVYGAATNNVPITGALSTVVGSWVRLTLTFTASTTGVVGVYVVTSGNGNTLMNANTSFYLDAVKLEVGSTATSFVPRTYANLISNPSLEVDTTGWGNIGGAPIVRSTAQSYVGTASLQATCPALSSGGKVTSNNTTIAVAGQTYTVSCAVLAPVGVNVRVGLEMVAAGGTDHAGTGTWQVISETFTSNINVMSAGLLVTVGTGGCPANTVIYIDAGQVELGHQANPFVDGTRGVGYSWETTNNLLDAENSSFEGGTIGNWTPNASGSGAVNSTAQAFVGTHSLQWTCASAITAPTDGPYTAAGPSYPVGTTVTVSLWVFSTSAFTAAAACTQSSGGIRSIGAYVAVSANTWTRLAVTHTLDLAGIPIPFLSLQTVAAGQNIYIDAVQIEQRAYATPYGATGTATGSTSLCTIPWGLSSQEDGFVVRAAGGAYGSDKAIVGVLGSGSPLNPNLWASGASYKVVLAPNTTYTLSAYLQGTPLYVMVDGPALTTPTFATANSSGGFNRTGNLTFTTNSRGGVAYLRFYTLGSSNQFYLDAVQLEQRAYASPYGDAGAASVSTSTCTIPWGLTGQSVITRQSGGAEDGSWFLNATAEPNPNLYASGASYKVTLEANTTYTFSAYLKYGYYTAPGDSLLVDGPALAAPVQSTQMIGPLNNFKRLSVTFTTNSTGGTAYLRAITKFLYGQNLWIDAVQLEDGSVATPYVGQSVSTYGPARQIRVAVDARRVNEVINPGFDADTSNWTAVNSALAHSSTTTYGGGVGSCQVTPSGAGASGASTAISVDGDRTIVAAAQVYSATTQNFTMSATWADQGGNTLQTNTVAGFTVAAGTWLRLEMVGVLLPPTATTGVLTIEAVPSTGGTAGVFYIDDVLAELLPEPGILNLGGSTPYDLGAYGGGPFGGSNVLRYFDPYNDPVDAVWEGTINASRLHLYPLMGIRRARLEDLLSKTIPLGATYKVALAQPRPW